jgi:cell division protein ZapE
MLSLLDRRPSLSAAELLDRFVPPRRFVEVRFENFIPNPDHPSQRQALGALQSFATVTGFDHSHRRGSWLRRRPSGRERAHSGIYLDGGFGVGKTHLLASLWHTGPSPKVFLTFAELTALIGFLGMDRAIEAFSRYRLVCIDEFELDDVANTLMTVTFLRAIIGDTLVAATSNTLPDKLGEGRFAAADFQREIAAIANHFDVVRVDGPDYRARDRVEAEPFTDASLVAWAQTLADSGAAVSSDRLTSILGHLRVVHPVQVAGMLDGIDAVAIGALAPITNQGDALLFVHLVDELYDAGVAVAASGCAVSDLFPASYRHGGYRKKYGRCESRLLALLGAAATATRS